VTRKTEMARWIVTGCNGYLGGVLCQLLRRDGKSVIGVARNGRNVENLVEAGVECLTYEMLDEVIKPGDIIVHCAGKTGTTGSWDQFESINVRSSISLYQRAITGGAGCFFYVSSIASLGYVNRKNQTELNDESLPELHVGEFYGRSKLLAEENLQTMSHEVDTRLVILRPGLIYGRRPVKMQQKCWRRPMLMDRHERIPLCYVDNFYDALIKAAENLEANGKFLVVDDEQPTRNELDDIKIKLGVMQYRPWFVGKSAFMILLGIKAVMGRVRGQSQLSLGASVGAQVLFCGRHSRYCCSNLKNKTGWNPTVTMDEGWRRVAEVSKIQASLES